MWFPRPSWRLLPWPISLRWLDQRKSHLCHASRLKKNCIMKAVPCRSRKSYSDGPLASPSAPIILCWAIFHILGCCSLIHLTLCLEHMVHPPTLLAHILHSNSRHCAVSQWRIVPRLDQEGLWSPYQASFAARRHAVDSIWPQELALESLDSSSSL